MQSSLIAFYLSRRSTRGKSSPPDPNWKVNTELGHGSPHDFSSFLETLNFVTHCGARGCVDAACASASLPATSSSFLFYCPDSLFCQIHSIFRTSLPSRSPSPPPPPPLMFFFLLCFVTDRPGRAGHRGRIKGRREGTRKI